MSSYKMEWISTPSHGYLKVEKKAVYSAGYEPSGYSYQNGKFFYLEEDCDAGEFFQALWGDEWRSEYVQASINDRYTDNFIESMAQRIV
ncbi:MAG: hypothetical protein NZ824_12200 [Candidatus Thioglobus sp.]|nr:hypothetical protein [Candidatus Thioglobus sp.]